MHIGRSLFQQTTAALTTVELERLPGRDQPSGEEPPCKRRKGETDMIDFLDLDDERDHAAPSNGQTTTPDDRIKAVQAELQAYLGAAPCDMTVDPLQWWSASAAAYQYCML